MNRIPIGQQLFLDSTRPMKPIKSKVLTKSNMERLLRSCSAGKPCDEELSKFQFLTRRKMFTESYSITPGYYDVKTSSLLEHSTRRYSIGHRVTHAYFHVPSPSRYNVKNQDTSARYSFPKAGLGLPAGARRSSSGSEATSPNESYKSEPDARNNSLGQRIGYLSASLRQIHQTFPTALERTTVLTPGPGDYEIPRGDFKPKTIGSSRDALPKTQNFMADLACSGESFVELAHCNDVRGGVISRAENRFKTTPPPGSKASAYDTERFYAYAKPNVGCSLASTRTAQKVNAQTVREANRARTQEKRRVSELYELNYQLRYGEPK